jgi:hypothetical protein
MTTDRPVLLLCPVRNAIYDLKRSVPTWELIADKVIVVDQNSTDGTRQFLQSRDKVILVDNPGLEYDEVKRNILLVEAARKVHRAAIHLTLDADEILSSNVLESPEWKNFRQMEPGTVGELSWVQLWKNPAKYIAKGVGAPGRYRLAFIDDGRPVEGKKRMHEQRGVGVQRPERTFVFNDIVCLHYAWVNFQAAIRRNNYYKVHWVMQGAKSFHVNNRNHGWHRSIRDENISTSSPQWLNGYTSRGIDVTSSEECSLYWWDIEVLKAFKAAGVKKFRGLDIWREVDWEQLRQIAEIRGVDGIDTAPIIPPGLVRRSYHALTVDGLEMSSAFRKIKRYVAAKVLP